MADHCILDYKQEPQKMRCLHCGAEEPINLPMPIRQVVVITNSFIDEHKHCKKVVGELPPIARQEVAS